jgi:exosortase
MGATQTARVRPSTAPAAISRAFYLQLLVIVVLVGLIYYDVILHLVRDWWTDPDYSHGFVVPLFSAYVIWSRRRQLRLEPTRGSVWGLALIIFGLGLVIVGSIGAELFLSRTSLLWLIAGLIIYFFGWRYFRLLLFPWAFLFLMIPLPAILFNQVTFPLQLLASNLATHALRFVGVPVLREGNVITLPALPLEVAEACSGIRSLISLGAVAIVYGNLLVGRNSLRLVLALAAVPIAVLANVARIVGTGLLVQYWNPEKALGFFHEFSGWIMFMIAVGFLVLVHAAIHRLDLATGGQRCNG